MNAITICNTANLECCYSKLAVAVTNGCKRLQKYGQIRTIQRQANSKIANTATARIQITASNAQIAAAHKSQIRTAARNHGKYGGKYGNLDKSLRIRRHVNKLVGQGFDKDKELSGLRYGYGWYGADGYGTGQGVGQYGYGMRGSDGTVH